MLLTQPIQPKTMGEFSNQNFSEAFDFANYKQNWPWGDPATPLTSSCVSNPSLTIQSLMSQTTLVLEEDIPTGLQGLIAGVNRSRAKLESLTQTSEQLRLKTLCDQAHLSSPKLFQRQQFIESWFSPDKSSFSECCADLRAQLDPITNTILRDNKFQLQKFQVVKEDEFERIELFEPVALQDCAALTVEQIAFGAVFPRLWRRAKQEFSQADAELRRACAHLRDEENLRGLIAEEKTQQSNRQARKMASPTLSQFVVDSPKVGNPKTETEGENVKQLAEPVKSEPPISGQGNNPDLLEDFLGIPAKFRDPCKYSLCVEELKQLDLPVNMTPRQFLNVLLETVVCVQVTVNTQTAAGLKQRGQQQKTVTFGADDMLPIFIAVLVNADLKNAVTCCEVMQHCCDPVLLNDEYGYYLTCFSSAINYVQEKWAEIQAQKK